MILDFFVDRLHVDPQVIPVERPVIAVLTGIPFVFGYDVDIKLLPGRRLVLALLAGEQVGVDVPVQDVGSQQLFVRGDEVALVAEGEHVLDVAVAILDVEAKVEGVVGHERALGALVTLAEKLGHLDLSTLYFGLF